MALQTLNALSYKITISKKNQYLSIQFGIKYTHLEQEQNMKLSTFNCQKNFQLLDLVNYIRKT